MSHRDAPRRTWLRTALGVSALVVFFVVMLGVIAVLAFSVRVTGSSMEPTLASGDRLFVDVFGKDDVERFDIVESTLGDREIPVVKRVIGMPGDRIEVRGGDEPVVVVVPAGEERSYVVDNPAWKDRVGDRTTSCCQDNGTLQVEGGEARAVTVPDGAYWVIGDNWGGSDDSRTFGFVTAAMVKAKIGFRILPLGGFGGLDDDVRLVPAD